MEARLMVFATDSAGHEGCCDTTMAVGSTDWSTKQWPFCSSRFLALACVVSCAACIMFNIMLRKAAPKAFKILSSFSPDSHLLSSAAEPAVHLVTIQEYAAAFKDT